MDSFFLQTQFEASKIMRKKKQEAQKLFKLKRVNIQDKSYNLYFVSSWEPQCARGTGLSVKSWQLKQFQWPQLAKLFEEHTSIKI